MSAPTSPAAPSSAGTGGATADGPDGPGAGTPTLRERLRRRRGTVLVALLVLATALLLAVTAAGGPGGLMMPEGTDRSGSGALVALLRAQGVRVDVARSAEEASAARPGETLLVALPDRMSRLGRAVAARSDADVVVVRPDTAALEALAPGVESAPASDGAATGTAPDPACALRAAVAAGPADLAADTYLAPPGATACYRTGDAAALVQVPRAGRSVTVVGDTAPFTNADLGERGNAALTLGLLGAHPRLVWYVPDASTDPADESSLVELLPPGWVWGAVELVAAGLLLALWRGRRFGRVVVERLPVVVRATETTEGRARLYRRAGARDRAAAALRADARRTLATRLGLPRGAPPPALVAAAAARSGRPAPAVAALLDGPPPTDDAGLVALAAELDALTAAVRGTAAAGDPATDPARRGPG